MPKVTAIKPQKRAERFNIYLDGKFAFGLGAGALVKSGLATGQVMSQPEVKRLKEENDYGKLLNKALKFLSFRPRSEFEVRINLKKAASSSPELIDRVTTKLQDLDLIGDLDFANWWVDQRTTHRPRGRRLLWQELRAKGVPQTIVEQVLEEKAPQLGGSSLALKAAQKKLKTYSKLAPREFEKKLSQHLARRGFRWDVIREVVARLSGTLPER